MIRTAILSLTLALGLGLAGAAHAASAVIVAPPGVTNSIITIGEGCGAGRWKGPGGNCNNFRGGEGNNRGTEQECPPGLHYEFHGAGTGRCYYNRP
jgi:hypothetical protein